MNQLSQRSARITDDQTAEIVRLAIRQLPYVEIAKRAGVHRNTVSRVLKRTRAALTINADLEIERS
jgi:DNA-directed RNA polymerase specialized sigma24 family protein